MRRDEHPVKRKNPSGKVRWLARWTDTTGRRRHGWKEHGIPGAHDKAGPCRATNGRGTCCAAHAIVRCYELDAEPETARDQTTVRAYFDGPWLKRHPRTERTEAGYKGRRAVLDMRTEDGMLGDLELRRVRPRHLDDVVDVMLRDGRAASGVRAVIGVLSTMFMDAIRDEKADMNPALLVTVRDSDPRVLRERRTPRLASWEEMHAFAAAAGEHEAMILTYADCGLRLGEGFALECKHARGDVLVVETKAWRGVTEPGTKQSPGRETPVPPRLAGMLAAARRDRIGLLFPDENGKAWTDRAFYRKVWYPAREASGLDLLPHDFRHSFVSLMRAAGVDPADLAAATGHTVQTATAKYTHATGATFDAMRRAVG